MSDSRRRPWSFATTTVFAVTAVALITTHLVLDTGEAEAPRWISYLAMATALVAAGLGGYDRNRRQPRR
jgi:hypothetical protein